MRRELVAAALAGTILSATSSAASAQDRGPDLSLSTGLNYSSGHYGVDQRTKILVLPLSARVSYGRVRVLATMPYLRINSPGTVLGGVDGGPIVVDPNTSMGRETRSGWGDLSVGATYSVPEQTLGGFYLDLTGRLKFPTSKTSEQLGTGKTDVSLSADLSRPLGHWTPFTTVGYRLLGDTESWQLRNSVSVSIGTSVQLGRTFAIISYDYARAVSRYIDDAHELFAGISGAATRRLTWTAYGTTGLSQGSPAIGGGVLLTVKLN